ncbi:hypothetical protein BASA81_000130 [Batrachochytrium salamandrivorans]|nr:hypothetical protein BASA81_000130 [Batrachochytrium salamandrivorans]
MSADFFANRLASLYNRSGSLAPSQPPPPPPPSNSFVRFHTQLSLSTLIPTSLISQMMPAAPERMPAERMHDGRFSRSNSSSSNNNSFYTSHPHQQRGLERSATSPMPLPITNSSFRQFSQHSFQSSQPPRSFPQPLLPPPPQRLHLHHQQPPLSQDSLPLPAPSLTSFNSSQSSSSTLSSSSSQLGDCLEALSKHERKLDEVCLSQQQTNELLNALLAKLRTEPATRKPSLDLLAADTQDQQQEPDDGEEDDLWKDEYPESAEDLFAKARREKELVSQLKRLPTFQSWNAPKRAKPQ